MPGRQDIRIKTSTIVQGLRDMADSLDAGRAKATSFKITEQEPNAEGWCNCVLVVDYDYLREITNDNVKPNPPEVSPI